MHNIVNFVLTNYGVIAGKVSHIKLLIAAGKSDLLVADVCCYDIVFADLIAEGLNKRNSDLAFASCNKHPLPFLKDEILITYKGVREGALLCCSEDGGKALLHYILNKL